MKIVHLCLACFFPDGFTYQENMLPKWHKRLGYDVEVIASLLSFDEYGRDILLPGPSRYLNEYAIPVTRLAYKEPVRLYRKLGRYIGLPDALEKAAPDTLFIHGCQFLDIDIVVAYLKYHRNVKVYVDNHADYSNSARNWLSKHILHRIIWKRCAQLIEPFTITFWGVLPARVDFLIDNYGIQREKCDLLIMGADDDEVERAVDRHDEHVVACARIAVRTFVAEKSFFRHDSALLRCKVAASAAAFDVVHVNELARFDRSACAADDMAVLHDVGPCAHWGGGNLEAVGNVLASDELAHGAALHDNLEAIASFCFLKHRRDGVLSLELESQHAYLLYAGGGDRRIFGQAARAFRANRLLKKRHRSSGR